MADERCMKLFAPRTGMNIPLGFPRKYLLPAPSSVKSPGEGGKKTPLGL